VKLVLVLSVTTATVERIFSTKKLVKTYMRNLIDDEYMSNSLILRNKKWRKLQMILWFAAWLWLNANIRS
jgi:hypothetical protein